MSNLLEVIQAINIQGKKIRKITRNDKTYDNEELKIILFLFCQNNLIQAYL